MAIELTSVPYGPEASRALHAAVVAAKAGDPLAPVTVVVPTNYVGVAARRLLGSGVLGRVTDGGAGVAGVTFLTVYRLAELLGAPRLAAAHRRPVSTPVLAAAVRAVLADAPGRFRPVAEHPATEEALVAAHRELSTLDDAALDALVRTGRARRRRRAHQPARARLARPRLVRRARPHGHRGRRGRRRGAAARRPRRGRRAPPAGASTPAAALLRARRDPQCRSRRRRHHRRRARRRARARRAGPARPRAARRRASLRRTGRRRASCRRPIPTTKCAPWCGWSSTRLRDGVPLERMAVLYGAPEPYARLVHEQLDAAGIPHNGAAVRTLADSALGRGLLGLLALPDRDFQRHDVMRLLATTPGPPPGPAVPSAAGSASAGPPEIVRGARALARAARTVRGHRSRASSTAERAVTDRDPRPQRYERELARHPRPPGLRRRARARPRGSIPAASWRDLAGWAERPRPRPPRPRVRAARRGPRPSSRPPRRSTPRSTASPGSTRSRRSPGVDVFRRTLELELDADLGRVGRFGDGLLMGHVALGLGLDLDRVFVCGLAEGTLPRPRARRLAAPRRRPPRHRRRAAAACGPGRRRPPRVCSPRSRGAADERVLLFPRGDLRRTTERVPSRFLLDMRRGARRHPPATPKTSVSSHADWYTAGAVVRRRARARRVPGDRAGAPAPHAARPRARRRCDRRRTSSRRSTARSRAASSRVARAREPAPSRASTATSPATPSRASPTATWSCRRRGSRPWAVRPHDYLIEYVLRVEIPELPEERYEVSPLDRGSLVHETLDEFLAEVLARPERRARPRRRVDATPTARGSARSPRRAWRCTRPQGRTGRRLFWHRDRRRILADLDRFLTDDADVRAEYGLATIATELRFGFADGAARGRPPALRRARAALPRRGRPRRREPTADRSGSSTTRPASRSASTRRRSHRRPARRSSSPSTRTRLEPSFGTADTPVGAAYWFVSTRGEFRVGGARARRRGRRARRRGAARDRRRHRARRVPVPGRPAQHVARGAGAATPTPTRAARATATASGCASARPPSCAATSRSPSPTKLEHRRRGRRGMTPQAVQQTVRLDLDEDLADTARAIVGDARRHAVRRGRRGLGQDQGARRPDRRAGRASATCPMREIAAVTFTEKAAAELRDRIRRALEHGRALRRTGRRGRARRWRSTSSTRAAVSTLHAFAQRHPRRAPGRGRAAARGRGARRDRVAGRVRGALDPLRRRAARRPRARAHHPPRPQRRHHACAMLRTLALACNANWDLVAERMHAEPDPPPLAPRSRRCSARSTRSCALGGALPRPRRQAARRSSHDSPRGTTQLLARPRRVRAAAAAHRGGPRRSRATIGKKDELARRLRRSTPSAAEVDGGARAGRRARRRDVTEAVVRRLAWELAQFTLREARRAPAAAGELEFHDLLVLARALLRDPEHGWEVRSRLRARYTRLLLDEFQDTDPIQFELAVLLASGDPDARARPWDEIAGRPRPPVRRRRPQAVDLPLPPRRHRRVPPGPRPRSAPRRATSPATSAPPRPVIEWVNHVFGELIVAEPESQPEYVALDPVRERAAGRPGRGAARRRARTRTSRAADQLREREAADVAAAVAHRARAKAGRSSRPSARRHRGVRSRAGSATSASCCRRARRSATSRTRSTPPASRTGPRRRRSSTAPARSATCSCVLQAVDDPTDELALVERAALAAVRLRRRRPLHVPASSTAGAGTTRRRCPSRCPPTIPVGDGDARARARWHDARHVARRRASCSTASCASGACSSSAFAHGRPRDLWRRLRFVVDQARAFADADGGSAARLPALGRPPEQRGRARRRDGAARDRRRRGAHPHHPRRQGPRVPDHDRVGHDHQGRRRAARGVQLLFPHDSDTYALRVSTRVTTEEFERYAADRRADGLPREAAAPLRRVHPRPRPPRRLGAPAGRSEPGDDRTTWTHAELLWDAAERAAGLDELRAPPPTICGRRRADAAAAPVPRPPPWDEWLARARRRASRTARAAAVRSATALATRGGRAARRAPPIPGWPRTRATSSCRRGTRAATAPRSGGRCTRCCRPSTSPPARGSTTPPRRRRRPRASSDARTTSPRSRRVALATRRRARGGRARRTGARCTWPCRSTASRSRATSTSSTAGPTGWSSSTTRPTRGRRRRPRRQGRRATGSRARRTRSRWNRRPANRWRGACSCSSAATRRRELAVSDLPAAMREVRAALGASSAGATTPARPRSGR